MKEFKEGMEVIDPIRGRRGILEEEYNSAYPLKLACITYTRGGKESAIHKHRSLFTLDEIVDGCIKIRVEPEKIVRWFFQVRDKKCGKVEILCRETERDALDYKSIYAERIGPPQKVEFEIE